MSDPKDSFGLKSFNNFLKVDSKKILFTVS